MAIAAPLAGALYQFAGERRDGRRFPAPGRLYPTPHARLHLWPMGEQGPAVLLESGIAASSINWRLIQEPLSREARVYAYDRAGFGWSPRARAPRVLPQLVEELNSLVEAAGIPTPLVLVGHSFGGLLVRHFAARYPAKTSALVLVDPLEPFEWRPLEEQQAWRLGKGVMLSRRGAWLAQLGVVRASLALLLSGSNRIPRLIAKASSGRGSAVPDRIVGELKRLPRQWWDVIAAHWCLPRSFATMADYLERLPENCAVPLDPTAFAGIPLTVISGERTAPRVIEEHARTAASSRQGRHVVAQGSGHWIHLDNPGLVLDEIRRLLPRPV